MHSLSVEKFIRVGYVNYKHVPHVYQHRLGPELYKYILQAIKKASAHIQTLPRKVYYFYLSIKRERLYLVSKQDEFFIISEPLGPIEEYPVPELRSILVAHEMPAFFIGTPSDHQNWVRLVRRAVQTGGTT